MTELIQPTQINKIVDYLQAGKLVAMPTDTVYGLAVISSNAQAIKAMRIAKNRPDEKAFAYMVDSLAKIEQVCELTKRDRELITKWLPGPITFIFKKKKNEIIVDESGYETLAIRIPNHPLILSVISDLKVGLYVPSANLSGQPAGLNSEEVFAQLNGRIDAIVEGTSLGQSASTIIDASGDELKCLREGPIALADIVKSLGEQQ